MNLGRLVRRQALSHPVRAFLTVGAVAVAIFLLCFLRSIVTSLDAAVTESSGRRIISASAVLRCGSTSGRARHTPARMAPGSSSATKCARRA